MPGTTYPLLLSVVGGDVEHARLVPPLLDDAVAASASRRAEAERPREVDAVL